MEGERQRGGVDGVLLGGSAGVERDGEGGAQDLGEAGEAGLDGVAALGGEFAAGGVHGEFHGEQPGGAGAVAAGGECGEAQAQAIAGLDLAGGDVRGDVKGVAVQGLGAEQVVVPVDGERGLAAGGDGGVGAAELEADGGDGAAELGLVDAEVGFLGSVAGQPDGLGAEVREGLFGACGGGTVEVIPVKAALSARADLVSARARAAVPRSSPVPVPGW